MGYFFDRGTSIVIQGGNTIGWRRSNNLYPRRHKNFKPRDLKTITFNVQGSTNEKFEK